jgi:hypothetical protein
LKADELDQQGNEHLKPNALGYINKIGAESKFKAARKTRSTALKRVTDTSVELAAALASLYTESVNLKLSNRDQEILKSSADAIKNRTLTPADNACQEMRAEIKGASNKLASDDAERLENQELQAASKNQAAALRQMQRAIRTGDKSEEARALKMLMTDAPESVNGFNEYLAAKAAKERASREAKMARKIDEIERRTR